MPDTVKTLKLEIVLDETGAVKGVKGIGKATKGLKDEVEKTSKGMGKFTSFIKKNWLSIAAASATAFVTIKKAFNLSKQFLEYRQGMTALARNTGQNADAIVKKLSEVTKGTVANKDVMLAANRLVALNVTKDTDKMAQLFEIARVKAKAMGISTSQAISDISTGIGRASPLILDNLGIITKGWDKEAKAAGTAMNAQFILNKVLADGAKELAVAGATALTGAEMFQQLGATFSNILITLGKLVTPILLPFISALNKILQPTKDIESTTTDLVGALKQQKIISDKLTSSTEDLTDAEKDRLTVLQEINRIDILKFLIAANKEFEKQTKKIEKVKNVSEFYTKALESVQAKLAATKDETIELTNEEVRLLGVNAEMEQSLDGSTRAYAKRSDILKVVKEAELRQRQSLIKTKAATDEADASNRIFASGLIEGNVTRAEVLALGEKRAKQIDAMVVRIKAERKALEEAGKAGKDKVEEDKRSVADFFDFVGNQRELDLIKEKEAFEKAKEGLARHLEERKITKEEFNLLDAEAEALHKERLLMIEEEFQNERMLLSHLAFNVFGEQYEDLTIKQKIEAKKILADQQKLAKDIHGALSTAVGMIVSDWADGMAELIVEGKIFKKSFGDVIKELIRLAAKLIVKLLIIKGLKATLGGPFSFLFAKGGLVPKRYDVGGAVVGASHSQGGVPIEAEGGEFMVRKSKVNADTLPILRAINNGVNNLSGLIPIGRQHMQEGGVVTNNNQQTSSQVITIGEVNIEDPDPDRIFNTVLNKAEETGVDLLEGK